MDKLSTTAWLLFVDNLWDSKIGQYQVLVTTRNQLNEVDRPPIANMDSIIHLGLIDFVVTAAIGSIKIILLQILLNPC